MTQLLVSSFSATHKESKNKKDSGNTQIGRKLSLKDVGTTFDWAVFERFLDIDFEVINETSLRTFLQTDTEVIYSTLRPLNTDARDIKKGIGSKLISEAEIIYDGFEEFNTDAGGLKVPNKPVQSDYSYSFRLVQITFDKPNPYSEYRYLPTSDFNIGSELIDFTTDFTEPLDLTKVKTVLSPVGSSGGFPWDLTPKKDTFKNLNYGYSINDFLIGGSTETNYPVADDAINPPVEPPPSIGVIKKVNVINVVKLPERTPINFTDFTLSTDLSSIAWVVEFTIGNQESLDLLKPTGTSTVDVEININGEIFNCFISKTKTSFASNNQGVVKKVWKCTGWSYSKLLTYPYHPKRSHTETSSSTPAGLLAAELSGTGFSGTWNSVSWTIPANVFSYIEKTPLAAIAELAEAVGAVIVPDPIQKAFSVEKYYPTNPWLWDTVSVDYNLNEGNFYTIDTEWLPKQSPDSIYVYGEETGGAAVKCVKQGTAGLVTLPTIVNKYITDTIAGTERGRIELGKNAFKEIIPVSTYVDQVDGIIKPQSLLQVTPVNGSPWRGMVIGTSVSIKKQGTAVIQKLQIERHYD